MRTYHKTFYCACYISAIVEHRAVLNDRVPRQSLVFFYAPALDVAIAAPDAIVRADGGRRYKSFTWGEYLGYLKQHNYEFVTVLEYAQNELVTSITHSDSYCRR